MEYLKIINRFFFIFSEIIIKFGTVFGNRFKHIN